jgi:hypothetical protein
MRMRAILQPRLHRESRADAAWDRAVGFRPVGFVNSGSGLVFVDEATEEVAAV